MNEKQYSEYDEQFLHRHVAPEVAARYKARLFDDMAAADAWFVRVLYEAAREVNPDSVVAQPNGLNFVQFLRHICVEIGAKIDDRSEYHAIHAFVRRCVGTYEGDETSESSEGSGED